MLRALAPRTLAQRAEEAMRGQVVHSIAESADVLGMLAMMSDLNCGSLIVSGSGTREPVGIVTERDVLRKLEPAAPLGSVRVEHIMTPSYCMATARRDSTLDECLATMHRGGFRHLPIVSGDEGSWPVGMISVRDLSRELALESVEVAARAPAGSSAAAAATLTVAELSARRASRVHLAGTLKIVAELAPSATVSEAVATMRERNAGAVLVPTRGASIAESRLGFGIFTERDYLRLLGSFARLGVDVSTLMRGRIEALGTPPDEVATVRPDALAHHCLATMCSVGARHLPIVEEAPPNDGAHDSHGCGHDHGGARGSRLVAVLSARDVLAQYLDDGQQAAT